MSSELETVGGGRPEGLRQELLSKRRKLRIVITPLLGLLGLLGAFCYLVAEYPPPGETPPEWAGWVFVATLLLIILIIGYYRFAVENLVVSIQRVLGAALL
jgi:hypothetical protein